MVPELFLSTFVGGLGYVATNQYFYYQYKLGVEITFNKSLDLRINQAKVYDIRRTDDSME
jgi:hypothetical protein